MTRTLAADGTFSPAATISPSEDGWIDLPSRPPVALCSSGGGRRAVQARTRAPNGSLTQVQTLSRGSGGLPEVGVDGAGNAVFTWFTFDGIEVRTRANDGTLGPTTTLGPGDVLLVSPSIRLATPPSRGVRVSGAGGLRAVAAGPRRPFSPEPRSGGSELRRLRPQYECPRGVTGKVLSLAPATSAFTRKQK